MILNDLIEKDPDISVTIGRIESIYFENKKHNPFLFPWTKIEKSFSKSIYLTNSITHDSPFTFFIGVDFPNLEMLVFKLKPLFTKLASQISATSGNNYTINHKTIYNQVVIGIG